MPVRAVCFDVGETLIDETRHWLEWAEFLDVPAMTLFTAIGVVMERGESLRRVFDIFRPGLSPNEARKLRAAQGWAYEFIAADLYPDALPCLTALRDRGYKVLIAGNQPVESEASLARLELPADVIASSAGWGVSKPDPRFFQKVVEIAGVPADQIAYVGDRLDNDVLPSRTAGMVSVFLRRGPWGWIHAEKPEMEQAHIRIDSLLDLPDRLAALRDAPSGETPSGGTPSGGTPSGGTPSGGTPFGGTPSGGTPFGTVP
ncbi:MAG TPA: HAD family hydrolase [Rhodopila sp.]|uniref:HAD family hydrolase n=1 Tax=Rhodopila sp. TaxID=2480087 RepID=UPI002CC4753D|nr:HAD family hydrolase [Rhodopila sp.]HVY17687.1 HAD family hydrolase [Rhodopila sp.]